jgi:hypothetical protein
MTRHIPEEDTLQLEIGSTTQVLKLSKTILYKNHYAKTSVLDKMESRSGFVDF